MLTVEIYRNPRRPHRGLISALCERVTLVNADGSDREFGPEAPPVIIDSHRIGVLRAVPAVRTEAGLWAPVEGHWMASGAYVASAGQDLRFVECCERVLMIRLSDAVGHLEQGPGMIAGVAGWGMVTWYGAVALHDYREPR